MYVHATTVGTVTTHGGSAKRLLRTCHRRASHLISPLTSGIRRNDITAEASDHVFNELSATEVSGMLVQGTSPADGFNELQSNV